MLQPSISLSGFTLHEPVTVFTDLLLSALCLFLFKTTHKYHAKLWSYFFMTMAFATFFGAMGHGLYIDKNNGLQWISRCFGIVSVWFASLASLDNLSHSIWKKRLWMLAHLEVLIALVCIFFDNNFRIVATNGTVGFVGFVALIHFYLMKKGVTGSGYIIIGILINAIAGIVHKLAISPGKWFNHNDLSHVIMLFGLFTLAKGAKMIRQHKTIS